MLVICEGKDTCDVKDCPHRKPHVPWPIPDMDDAIEYCNEVECVYYHFRCIATGEEGS